MNISNLEMNFCEMCGNGMSGNGIGGNGIEGNGMQEHSLFQDEFESFLKDFNE